MRTSPIARRIAPPPEMDDDTLVRRIFEYRNARQVLNGEDQKRTRMELEAALAELEAVAIERGLKDIDQ